jgi:D-alanyl-D-alanine carboxypeptidase
MRSFLDNLMFAAIACVIIAIIVTTPARTTACSDEDFLQVVDKQQSLPSDYEPNDLIELASLDVPSMGRGGAQLRYHAALAYARMAKDAQAQGSPLIAVSGYRSYAQQRYVFHQNVLREMAVAEEASEPITEITATARANGYSARAGHSEHQLGTTLDISTREIGGALIQDLAFTAAGQWLAQHAHEYGFVLSYPAGKEALTGYVAEPWHVRWVGEPVARALYELNYLDPSNTVTLASYLKQRQPAPCGASFIP